MASAALQDRESDTAYRAPRANLQLRDFDVIGRIGDGSFSTVILARLRETGVQYAIKIVNKHLIVRNKMVDYVRAERNILDQLSDNDGICKLLFTFQDADSLCRSFQQGFELGLPRSNGNVQAMSLLVLCRLWV
jgi:3-phosphoinositide dependent protein kinase-1